MNLADKSKVRWSGRRTAVWVGCGLIGLALMWLGNRHQLQMVNRERLLAVQRLVRLEAELARLDDQARALRMDNLKLRGERDARKAEATRKPIALEETRKKIAAMRARAKLYYRAFFEQMGFEQAKQDRWVAAAAEHRLRLTDLSEMWPSGVPHPSTQSLRDEENAAFQTLTNDLLGPAGAAALAQYDRAAPARSTIATLASNVYDTEPLTAAQSAALLPIFTQASPSYQSGGKVQITDLDGNAQSTDLNWDAVLAQAGSILSTGQLAALKEQHTTEAALNAMWKRAYALGYKY